MFFLSVSDSLLGDSTVLIHKKHLELWGVSPEALYDLALENTRREYGVSLTPLAIAAGRTDPPSFISSIFVFTNRARAFGAACLLYDDVLRDFSDRHGSFYVLPSSIHETILVPEKSGATPAFLSDMVRQVNENDVAPEEVLSDQIYYYRKDEKRLGMNPGPRLRALSPPPRRKALSLPTRLFAVKKTPRPGFLPVRSVFAMFY